MGAVSFIDTSVFVAILAESSIIASLSPAIAAAERRLSSPIVRLETSIVLGSRLLVTPCEAERQYEKFLDQAEVVETPIDSTLGAAAVACFENMAGNTRPGSEFRGLPVLRVRQSGRSAASVQGRGFRQDGRERRWKLRGDNHQDDASDRATHRPRGRRASRQEARADHARGAVDHPRSARCGEARRGAL